ncbi:hypothetical protein BX600DRAFT_498400 [Xylariales sp. PMI_506]|nr:hypothetical protein BX600DRAFT_498400 [Xylariales sp. PMI_506]
MSSELASKAPFEETFRGYLHRQLLEHQKPLPLGTTLEGQTMIVTGSNGGIGLEACRQFLALKLSRLILAVRSSEKGEAAAAGLRKQFPKTDVQLWKLDMADYTSITAFAKRCDVELDRVDAIILNAGLINELYTVVESTGHEEVVQVNYLSTMLLAVLVLPVLKKKKPSSSKPSTLCIVSSDAAYGAPVNKNGPILSYFDDRNNFTPMGQYSSSKLLQVLFITKLATLVSSDDVVLNMVNPGFTANTSLGEEFSSMLTRLIFTLLRFLLGRSTETGASTLVDAVVSRAQESHGSFLSDWAIKPYPSILYTPEGAEIRERLWEETLEELSFADTSKIIQDLK